MARFKKEKEEENGWSRWVPPASPIYRLGCCDCGLVHDMEFAVVEVIGGDPDNVWQHGEALDSAKYKVLFRARRNNRSTAALRRNKDYPHRRPS